MVITVCSFHARLPQGGWRVVCSPRCARSATTHPSLCGPAVVLRPVRRAACLGLLLEGAGLVLGFAGRRPVPRCPVELHPLGELLLSTIFQNFSGLEIDLHRGGLSCAHRALLRFSKTSTVFFQGVFLRAVCCSGAPAGACAPP